MRGGSGGLRYYHRNQQYSITAVSDGGGSVVERYAYSAYGQVTIAGASGSQISNSEISNRYTYTGREWDEGLSLYHYRARMYDAASGQFIGRDPLRYIDGVSLYHAYFSPSRMDPSGTEDCTNDTTKSEKFQLSAYDALGGRPADYLLKPLSVLVAKFSPLEYYIKSRITRCCDGDGNPSIEIEPALLGKTHGGVDVTVYNIGFRFSYNVAVGPTDLVHSETVSDDKGCKTLTNIYHVQREFAWSYAFVFLESGSIDLPPYPITVSHTCCCEKDSDKK
jgi:RHS repeat-associated protein